MTKMPAILIECGFMDSTTDTPIILTDNFADKVADACAEVILRESGAVVKNDKDTQPQLSEKPNNTAENTVSNTLYRVRMSYDDASSQIGAFTVLENAIKAAKQGRCNVYEYGGKCVWSYEESNSTQAKNITEGNKEKVNENSEKFFAKIIAVLKYALKYLGL